jgi:hypothetical protein
MPSMVFLINSYPDSFCLIVFTIVKIFIKLTNNGTKSPFKLPLRNNWIFSLKEMRNLKIDGTVPLTSQRNLS